MKHKVKKGKHNLPIKDSTYKHVLKLRVLGVFAFGMYTLVAVLTAVFVYTNVYNAIGFVDLAALANIDTGAEVIDFGRLQQVKSAWENKQTASTTEFNRNPFSPVISENVSTSTPVISPQILPESSI